MWTMTNWEVVFQTRVYMQSSPYALAELHSPD